MQDPRPTHDQTHARPSRKIAICARRVAGRLLVTKAEEADPKRESFLRDVYNGDADDSEQNRHTKGV